MKTAIIIPARYGSTRFPGKPLAQIGDKSMVQIVYDNALSAIEGFEGIVCVATDDERIKEHCDENNMQVVMTDSGCATGTDRVANALDSLSGDFDFVVNLQGDAPFCYPDFIRAILDDFQNNPESEIVTPVVKLTWDELDGLRESKKITPFSGTSAVLNKDNQCLWFSKNILPAIRKEESLREQSEASPVYRHIGLYGYTSQALKRFVSLPVSTYEEIEGLEQLRALENNMRIRGVIVNYNGRPSMSGIDSPQDLELAQALFSQG